MQIIERSSLMRLHVDAGIVLQTPSGPNVSTQAASLITSSEAPVPFVCLCVSVCVCVRVSAGRLVTTMSSLTRVSFFFGHLTASCVSLTPSALFDDYVRKE